MGFSVRNFSFDDGPSWRLYKLFTVETISSISPSSANRKSNLVLFFELDVGEDAVTFSNDAIFEEELQ